MADSRNRSFECSFPLGSGVSSRQTVQTGGGLPALTPSPFPANAISALRFIFENPATAGYSSASSGCPDMRLIADPSPTERLPSAIYDHYIEGAESR